MIGVVQYNWQHRDNKYLNQRARSQLFVLEAVWY